MKLVVMVCGSLILALAATSAERSDVARQELAKLVEAYDAAILSGDVAFMERRFDDQGEFVGTEGRIHDKRGYIAEIVKGKTYATAESKTRLS